MKLIAALVIAAAALPVSAQTDAILLPLVVDTPSPGAHGSLWRTDLVVRNDGPHDVWVSVACEDVCGPSILRPNESIVNPTITGLPRGAAYLFGPPERLDQIQVSLRVRDLSRQAESFGTEVPVIRLDSIDRHRITFLDLPGDSRFRHTLRLYSPATYAVPVVIRVRDLAEPDDVVTEVHARIEPSSYKPFQFPAYAEIVSLGGLSSHERLVVEVEAASGERIWGLISVTNNETQQVTLISPR